MSYPVSVPLGRPTSFTRPVAQKLAERIAEGVSFRDACVLAGVSYTTAVRWKKLGSQGQEPYVEFWTLLRQSRRGFVAALITRVSEGEPGWQGAAWMLERHPDTRADWGPKTRFDQDDDDALDYSKLSDEDLETVERITRKAKEA